MNVFDFLSVSSGVVRMYSLSVWTPVSSSARPDTSPISDSTM